MIDLNAIFKNQDLCDPPTKPPMLIEIPRVKVQSKDPTRVPRVQLHSNHTPRVPRVQPPATTSSTKPTLRQSNRIRNLSKPIVYHNENLTIHLSSPEEKFISDIEHINAILDPPTGDLLEICQLSKTPDAKLWRYGAFNKLSGLTQGNKKKNIKGTNTIHFISTYQKPTNEKPIYALIVVSY